jgi:hypothetical protein
MALVTAPRHVLTLKNFSLQGSCMPPFFGADDSVVHDYYVAARHALQGVRQSDLVENVRLCEQLLTLLDQGKNAWDGLRCDTSGWAKPEADTLSLGPYLTVRAPSTVTLDTSALARLLRFPGGVRWTGHGIAVELDVIDSVADSAMFNATRGGVQHGATSSSAESQDSLPRPPSGWLAAWDIYGSTLYDVELFAMPPRAVRVVYRVHIYACVPAGAAVAQQVARSLAWVH